MRSDVTVTDQFCGAGGSSYGAEQAGAKLKLALNHWPLAIETHNSNFPHADHDCTDVSACDPRRYPSTSLLITSPECTNHTLAQGRKRKYQTQLELFGKVTVDPTEERSRATMWDVVRFAEYHQYQAIIVENVVEVRYWQLWEPWLKAMEALGYCHQEVYFNSQFAHLIPGRSQFVPQSRDRVYIVFWKRGNKAPNLDFRPLAYCPKCGRDVEAVQVWKNPQKKWGKYRFQYLYHCPKDYKHGAVIPYSYGAWHAIDWGLPIERIGDRKKPLKEKTLRRIEIGLKKFLGKPLVVSNYSPGYTQEVKEPIGTLTAHDHHALCCPPFLVQMTYTHGHDNRQYSVQSCMPTLDGSNRPGFVLPVIFNNQSNNNVTAYHNPLNTICGTNHKWLMTLPFLYGYQKPHEVVGLDSPLPTIMTKDKQALMAVPNSFAIGTEPLTPPAVETCGFRMLEPHEIGAGMAFPQEYIVLGNKKERVKQLGNAVTPPMMHLLVSRLMETFQ